MAAWQKSVNRKRLFLPSFFLRAQIVAAMTFKEEILADQKVRLTQLWKSLNGKVTEIAKATGWSRPTVVRKAKAFGLYKPLRRA